MNKNEQYVREGLEYKITKKKQILFFLPKRKFIFESLTIFIINENNQFTS